MMDIRAMVAAMMFAVLPAQASDGAVDHLNPPQTLTVEHAELLIPDDDAAEAYLTIWNGSQTQVSLTSVRSELFGRVTIVQTEFSSGKTRELPADRVLPIPGHAELSMRWNGVRLRLDQPASLPPDRTRSSLTLVFESGTELEVEADVVRSRNLLTRHRHGEGDLNLN
ncbi:copper chaperone PCu(A)C [Hyphomonas sp.]